MSPYNINENILSDKKNTKQNKKKGKRELENLFATQDDFEPEKSTRERRKTIRKFASQYKDFAYDDHGRLRYHEFLDVCDCFSDTCKGCFNPCPNCNSHKCGPVCRVNRKYTFEYYEYDGKDGKVCNKYNKS